jgi:hypothetical protein
MAIYASRKGAIVADTPPHVCVLKMHWSFGTLEIALDKNDIDAWRSPLMDGKGCGVRCSH